MKRGKWLLVLASGLIIFAFVFHPWSLREKLFAVAYGLDPQRPAHSYIVAGMQLPLEARKTGMFGGFLLSYLYLLILGRSRAAGFPPRRLAAFLGLCVLAMAVDGLNATLYDLSLPHAYAPRLDVRLATGLGMGLTMAAYLLPALNGSLWRDITDAPSLASGRELVGGALLLTLFFLAVDARLGILYYPIALFSVSGLLIELLCIGMVMVLALGRRVGTAVTLTDAVAPAVIAFVLVVGGLVFMSVVRYLTLGEASALM